MKKFLKKPVAIILAVVLLVGAVVGSTLAWLIDTDSKANVFEVSNIDITLTETTGNTYKMIPGWTIEKDPKVTVTANSEKCYLFVQMQKQNDFDDFMTYTMASGWIQLKDADNKDISGVFYREVDTSTTDQEFQVLANDTVTVLGTVTKEMMNAVGENKPQLVINAKAVQYFETNDTPFAPYAAWALTN